MIVGIDDMLEGLESGWRKAWEDVVRVRDHELVELELAIDFVEVLVADALYPTEI